MKKDLLFAALMLCGLSANSQEIGLVDVSALGLTSEGVATSAGTELVSTTSVTMKLAFDQTVKSTSVSGPDDADGNSFKYFGFNGNNVNQSNSAITGTDNPAASAASEFTPPTSGFVMQFDVTADGYIYVLCKPSSNKKYVAFEYPNAIAYDAAMAYSNNGTPDVMSYSLVGDELGYLSLETYPSGIDYYAVQAGVSDADNVLSANGCGVFKFPVYADAGKYYFLGTGTKVTVMGYYFDTTGDATVTVSSDGQTLTLFGDNSGDATAIKSVAAVEESSSNAATKSIENGTIVITTKDGKKYNVGGARIQ